MVLALAVPKGVNCDAKGRVARHIAPLSIALSLAGLWSRCSSYRILGLEGG